MRVVRPFRSRLQPAELSVCNHCLKGGGQIASFVASELSGSMSGTDLSHALEVIGSIVQSNVGRNEATDVYRVADEIQGEFPKLYREELVKLIELTVLAQNGAALWNDERR